MMKTLQNQQEPSPPDPICLQNASLNALQKLRPWMQDDINTGSSLPDVAPSVGEAKDCGNQDIDDKGEDDVTVNVGWLKYCRTMT